MTPIPTCLLVVALALQTAQTPTLAEAIARADAGEFGSAWNVAQRLGTPRERAQARVYVLTRSGQLRLALAQAERALADEPGDPWLTERACALAISLRETEIAARRSAELATTSFGMVHDAAVADLLAHGDRLRDALLRARACVAAGAMLLGAAFFLGARAAQKRPPQRGVDSLRRRDSPGFS